MLDAMARRTAFQLIGAAVALRLAGASQAAAASASRPNVSPVDSGPTGARATGANPAQGRPRWAITPLEGAGPLRFGMTMPEAAAVLPAAHELRRFQADHYFPGVGIEVGFSPTEPALYEYFAESGRLFCVAPDAVRGPLMTLDGMELTGGDPAELEPWLFDLADSVGTNVTWGPRGNYGIDELGLVLRVQDTADELRARPVLVDRDYAYRCADDWESAIPECEWVGYVWPDPRSPNEKKAWPPADYEPSWSRPSYIR